MSLTSDTAQAMLDRAARGEPEPGTYVCLRCERADCQMFTVVMDNGEARDDMGELNRLNRFDALLWTKHLKGILLCPCCSFPHLSGCSHPTMANCATCGRPSEPAGTWPGGGPFTRCAFDGAHPAAVSA